MKRYVAVLLLAVLLLCSCTPGKTNLPAETGTETTPAQTIAAPLRTVRVAVIDTGFSPHAIPAENVGEGKNYLLPDETTADTYGHGTAVASVILDNAESVLLIPLVSNVYNRGKVSFVDNDTFARMIRDAVDVYECEIVNISAGLVLDKPAVREAVAYAEEKGVLIVASAGNDYRENPGQIYYPAAYETVLAVGSLTADGTAVSDFSQRGDWVDVFAPGEDVPIRTLSGGQRTDKGSSYAAARITAAAVTLLQKEENLPPAELRERLCEKGNPETE